MINVFFAPDALRREIPLDRTRHPDFPRQIGELWTYAVLEHGDDVRMTYLHGFLLDHSRQTFTAEKVDGLELDIHLYDGRMSLEWWRTEDQDWFLTRGWTWHPARKINDEEAWAWISKHG